MSLELGRSAGRCSIILTLMQIRLAVLGSKSWRMLSLVMLVDYSGNVNSLMSQFGTHCSIFTAESCRAELIEVDRHNLSYPLNFEIVS
jgi:hypothetical protein